MKNLVNKKINSFLVLIVLLISNLIHSQPIDPPADDDPPPAPINMYLVIMFFIALILGYVMIKKYTKKSIA